MKKLTAEVFHYPAELKLINCFAADSDPESCKETVDWVKFPKIAAKNRIQPLIVSGLAAYVEKHKEELPSEALKTSQDINQEANQRKITSMNQVMMLAQVNQLFTQNDVRCISMKGPMLSMQLFGNPGARWSADLDVLISEDDFEKAVTLLLENGFEEVEEEHALTEKRKELKEKKRDEIHGVFTRNGLKLELHWSLNERYHVDFEQLWERRDMRPFMGTNIAVPGALDNMAYLITHAAAHAFGRERWLLDIYYLLMRNEVDFPELYRFMKEKNNAQMLFESLMIFYRTAEFPVEDIKNELFTCQRRGDKVRFCYEQELEADVKQGAQLADWAFKVFTNEEINTGLALKRYMSLLPGGKRMGISGMILSTLEPSEKDFARYNFPDQLYFLYYIVKPFDRLFRKLNKDK